MKIWKKKKQIKNKINMCNYTYYLTAGNTSVVKKPIDGNHNKD